MFVCFLFLLLFVSLTLFELFSQLGWLEPLVLNQEDFSTSMNLTLRPSELYPDVYKIFLDDSTPGEYLLLENRQPREFDIKMWPRNLGGGGLLIWHIDDMAKRQNQRGYPGQNGWPTNAKHYQVAVIQADGQYELELGTNHGNPGDFFKPGMSIGPSDQPNQNMNRQYPNTDTYSSRKGVSTTGIVIRVLEQDDTTLDITLNIEIPKRLHFTPPKDIPPSITTSSPEEQYDLSGKIPGPWMLDNPLYSNPVSQRRGNSDGDESYYLLEYSYLNYESSGAPTRSSWLLNNLMVTSTTPKTTTLISVLGSYFIFTWI